MRNDLSLFIESGNQYNPDVPPIVVDYLEKRGIHKDILYQYGIGYCVYNTFQGDVFGITIPTGEKSSVIRWINPTDPEKRYQKVGPSEFFNYKAFSEGEEPVFITEGEIDALSILEQGYKAVSLGSVSNADSFLRHLKDDGIRTTLILALDSDDAGQACITKMSAAAKAQGIACLPICFKAKDINELLCKDPDAFSKKVKRWAIEAAKLPHVNTPEEEKQWQSFLPHRLDQMEDSIKQSLIDASNVPQMKTGFPKLDELMGGGVMPRIVVIGAMPSLGKTTYFLQVASNIAAQGTDVFFFSFEMDSAELHAKNVVRQSYLTGNKYARFSTYEVLRGEVFNSAGKAKNYDDCCKKLSTTNKHLYVFEADPKMNINTIQRTVESYIELTGRIPVVFIDYLQMIPPISEKLTDKQNIDKTLLVLRQMKNKGIPCFIISSLSRASYDAPISMQSFKESGSIEFSADLALALDYEAMFTAPKQNGKVSIDLNAERKKDPRALVLTLLKNRLGQAGAQIKYDFYPAGNLFVELGEFHQTNL